MAGKTIRTEKLDKFVSTLENMAARSYEQCRVWEKAHGEDDRLALSAQVRGETLDQISQMIRDYFEL